MIKKDINQKDILDSEFLSIIKNNYTFNNQPIKRIKTKPILENPEQKLKILKENIINIENSDLKKNNSKIVFADGNFFSPLMLIGDGPSIKDVEMGKPFMDEKGDLLNKMLNAIKIKRENVYLTNVVNYLLPLEKKIEQSEINRYSEFLKEHISIINPKILILMGSMAMKSVMGSNKKISEERGKWKEIIIGKKHFKAFITFHPSYLLRKPDQKKLSWIDLKIIQKEIKLQNLNI